MPLKHRTHLLLTLAAAWALAAASVARAAEVADDAPALHGSVEGAAAATGGLPMVSTEPLAAPAAESSVNALQGLLFRLLTEVVPDRYTDDSKWGQTKYQTVGVHVRLDGLKLKTHRRKKHVNEGLWKLYRIDLADSDQWEVSLSEPRDLGDGRVGFEASFATPLKVLARASQWERGVQLYSISAQADAQVRLTLAGEVRLRLNAARLPPEIRLEPKVVDARLEVVAFRLNRISQLNGPLVRELGEEAHRVVQREVHRKREKLTSKLNQQIEKHQDKLTLSLADLGGSPWSMVTRFLPPAEATSE